MIARISFEVHDLTFNIKLTHRLETDDSNPLAPVHYCIDCGARGDAKLNAEPCPRLTPEELIIKKLLE